MDYPTHFRPVIEQQGLPAVWVHGSGTGATTGTVTGIYQRPYTPMVLGGVSLDGNAPRFIAMSADVPGLMRDDTIIVAGSTYTVKVPKADPVLGITVAELHK